MTDKTNQSANEVKEEISVYAENTIEPTEVTDVTSILVDESNEALNEESASEEVVKKVKSIKDSEKEKSKKAKEKQKEKEKKEKGKKKEKQKEKDKKKKAKKKEKEKSKKKSKSKKKK